jgi:hypothetical protein
MANISNGVLYGVFAFSAVGAGPLINLVGPRWTVLMGITGYPLYQGAMWYFDAYGHLWYINCYPCHKMYDLYTDQGP